MFAIKFRQLFYISDKIIVRNVRNRAKRLSNPGLSNRLKAFKKEGIALEDEDVEEYIEQSESDFYGVSGVYNEHINETLIGKHELRYHIVKDKYFKENMPNLLTWSEKEQIRHLATTEPNEWTPQRIAESFPVTEQVVKKLLKFPWKPASVERIARHDASAMRNWRELKEGTLDISEDLRQHFLKFSNRTIPPLNTKSLKIDLTPNSKIGEFEQIIRKCADNEINNKNSQTDDETENNGNCADHTIKVEKDFKKVTLDELATKIKKRLSEGNNINISDKMIIDTVSAKEVTQTAKFTSEIDLIKETKQDNQLTEFKKQDGQLYKITYAERIRIPKKAYKKGATYKVNDCFYDDDGRFLYRVVGLTGTGS